MAGDDSDSDEARTLRPLQAAACPYRIAFGPRAGQKVLTVQGAMLRDADFKQSLRADIDGNSATRCLALRRRRPPALEQLCRCITRPALANERVQTNAAGQVVLKLRTPLRDGTTHLVMSPLEFMQRLAALPLTSAAANRRITSKAGCGQQAGGFVRINRAAGASARPGRARPAPS